MYRSGTGCLVETFAKSRWRPYLTMNVHSSNVEKVVWQKRAEDGQKQPFTLWDHWANIESIQMRQMGCWLAQKLCQGRIIANPSSWVWRRQRGGWVGIIFKYLKGRRPILWVFKCFFGVFFLWVFNGFFCCFVFSFLCFLFLCFYFYVLFLCSR